MAERVDVAARSMTQCVERSDLEVVLGCREAEKELDTAMRCVCVWSVGGGRVMYLWVCLHSQFLTEHPSIAVDTHPQFFLPVGMSVVCRVGVLLFCASELTHAWLPILRAQE